MRYFATAADAAGREEEAIDAELSAALTTVGAVRAHLVTRYGEPMAHVLENGSFLVDGVVLREDAAPIGARVDVLPPFAGG